MVGTSGSEEAVSSLASEAIAKGENKCCIIGNKNDLIL